MKLWEPFIICAAFFFLGAGTIFAQGDRCSTIQPFCAGDSRLVFPNSNMNNSNFPGSEAGPNYGCLGSQPYPAWFFLYIADPGNLEFTIIQSQNADGSGALLDVDFIVWGPFGEGDQICGNTALSQNNIVDCSFSTSAVEIMRIPNALQNEVYVVLLTNFSQMEGYINLRQTNVGGGSTDCSIVGGALGPDLVLCGETSVELDASGTTATQFQWFKLNEVTGAYELIPNQTDPTLTVTESGNYRVTARSPILNREESDEITIQFFDIPTASEPNAVIGCEDGQGGALYDLTSAGASMIGNAQGNYTVNFYLTNEDYENSNPLLDPANYYGDQSSLLGTITNNESLCESVPVVVSLERASPPVVGIDETTALCVDLDGRVLSPVSLGEDLGPGYSYTWSVPNDPDGDGVENAILTLLQQPSQRIITLVVTNIATGCESTYSTNIQVFSPPGEVLVTIDGGDFSDGGYTVTAAPAGGIGDEAIYEFRLNNGPWQQSPVFTEVPGGVHRITAREINGCGSTVSPPFRLFGYPRFFSPNNDGYNDSWDLLNGEGVIVRRVVIFDRYGKLMTQLRPGGGGWDGTYNNKPMPAADYWFLLTFEDPETGQIIEYKGNFSLIR